MRNIVNNFHNVATQHREKKITIYAPMIDTAPLLMRADTLCGQVGEGWALEMESFFWALLNDIEPMGEKINERILSYRQQADFYAKFIEKREVFEKSAVSTKFLRKVHIFDKCAMFLLCEPKSGPAFAKLPDFGKSACIMRKVQILFII